MPDENSILKSIFGYGRKVLDEAVIRGVMDSVTKVAHEEAEAGLRKLKVKIFGWGDNDERISLEDQSELGQAAVRELNRYLESLDRYWTYRFRIIMGGINDQAKRLEIYRMILNLAPEDRQRQLEQLCQNPEYVRNAAQWLWERFRRAAQDREMRHDLRNIMRDIDAAAEQAEGTSWAWLRSICSGAARTARAADDECARLARELHRINERKRRERARPMSLGSSILWLFTGIRRP